MAARIFHKNLFALGSVQNSYRLFSSLGSHNVFDVGDYTDHIRAMDRTMETKLASPFRFQSIEERKNVSDLTFDTIKMQSRGRYLTKYRGSFLMKSPEDVVLYEQFLEVIKPKTIIELGTFTGANALRLADMSRLIGNDCEVYSVDIDHTLLNKHIEMLKPSNLLYMLGDCAQLDKVFNSKFLSNMVHPILLIEDVHVNTDGIMRFFHSYLKSGDYFVIEDTHPLIPAKLGMHADDPSYDIFGSAKSELVTEFMREFKDQYAVDTFFTDFFGYNYTWSMNSWIRKMK